MNPGRRRPPAADTARIALGTCIGCGETAYGHPVMDRRRGRTVRVEHCTGDARRDPPQLTSAAAVSVAAVVVVVVCVLLSIWR